MMDVHFNKPEQKYCIRTEPPHGSVPAIKTVIKIGHHLCYYCLLYQRSSFFSTTKKEAN